MENRFMEELALLINKYSKENKSDTPESILASFLWSVLQAQQQAICESEDYWFQRKKAELPVSPKEALASPKMANKKPVSRCSYLSCQHHYLDNWTGRCRLDLAYVRGQGACESYIKKDFGANAPVPKWYSRNQKERR